MKYYMEKFTAQNFQKQLESAAHTRAFLKGLSLKPTLILRAAERYNCST